MALKRQPPVTVEVVPKTSSDVFDVWLRGKSEASARNYRVDLECFANWLGVQSPRDAAETLLRCSPGEANATVYRYQVWLLERYATRTANRRLAALRSVVQLARLFGLVTWSIEIPGVREEQVVDTAGCGRIGVDAMLEAIDKEIASNSTPRLWRDRAILHLLFFAGLRRREPLTILFPEDLRMASSDGMPEARVLGKGRRDKQWVPIGHRTMGAINDWIEVRGRKPGYLFYGRASDKPLDPSSVNRIVTRIAGNAEVEVTPHGLRHAAITDVLDRTDGDVRSAQRFARHSSPKTTMVYDDARERAAAKAIEFLESDTDDD